MCCLVCCVLHWLGIENCAPDASQTIDTRRLSIIKPDAKVCQNAAKKRSSKLLKYLNFPWLWVICFLNHSFVAIGNCGQFNLSPTLLTCPFKFIQLASFWLANVKLINRDVFLFSTCTKNLPQYLHTLSVVVVVGAASDVAAIVAGYVGCRLNGFTMQFRAFNMKAWLCITRHLTASNAGLNVGQSKLWRKLWIVK